MITIEEYREAEERLRKAREEIVALEDILMKADQERLEIARSIYQHAIDEVYGEGEFKLLSIRLKKHHEVKGHNASYTIALDCEKLHSVGQRSGFIITPIHQHNYE
jgi:hypothetical protein